MRLSEQNSTPSDDIRSRSSVVFSSTASISSTNRDSSYLFELSDHHDPRLIPVKTTSFPPPSTNSLISKSISSRGRHLCRPRACTVSQNVQKLSHPVWMTIYLRVKSSLPASFLRLRIFSTPLIRGDTGGFMLCFLFHTHSSRLSLTPARLFVHSSLVYLSTCISSVSRS